MTDSPACRALLGVSPDAAPPRDCAELEAPRALGEKLRALRSFSGPRDTDEKKRVQEDEARRLLACVCRDGRCSTPSPSASPFDHEAYARLIDDASKTPDGEDELTCLSWAASALHEHKETGMTMGEALRCAFDDPTIAAERVYTATLEEAPCY
jgi:hypothetical protein